MASKNRLLGLAIIAILLTPVVMLAVPKVDSPVVSGHLKNIAQKQMPRPLGPARVVSLCDNSCDLPESIIKAHATLSIDDSRGVCASVFAWGVSQGANKYLDFERQAHEELTATAYPKRVENACVLALHTGLRNASQTSHIHSNYFGLYGTSLTSQSLPIFLQLERRLLLDAGRTAHISYKYSLIFGVAETGD